ncbi:hypothetical protein Hanom_Chr03g00271531 [Helianthus anomalus]
MCLILRWRKMLEKYKRRDTRKIHEYMENSQKEEILEDPCVGYLERYVFSIRFHHFRFIIFHKF